MRFPSRSAAILAVAVLCTSVHANEPNAAAAKNTARSEDPIVQAVRATINSVVAIRIPQKNDKDIVGSGVIVDEDGLIVTNRHVIGKERFVKVRLHDRTDLQGEVVFHDPDIDLAIVKIKTSVKLRAAKIGASDVILAEQAIAIGSPYGYDGTVSVGRISATDREIRMPNGVLMKKLIQTTAAINPGNSGGPLINVLGEVIGINVAVRNDAQNIAFAINSDTVVEFLNDYKTRVTKVGLGLQIEKKIVGEGSDRQVVLVKHAAQAELKQGDQIVSVADSKVANEFEITRALGHRKAGEKVEVRVLRNNQAMNVTLTLQANDGAGQVAAVPQESPATTANVRPASQR